MQYGKDQTVLDLFSHLFIYHQLMFQKFWCFRGV